MANLFAIVLAEDRRVFQPGDTISGRLLLNTDKEITLRGVRIELHGFGHVRIRSGKVTFERRETYLNFQSILLGRGKIYGWIDRFQNLVQCIRTILSGFTMFSYRLHSRLSKCFLAQSDLNTLLFCFNFWLVNVIVLYFTWRYKYGAINYSKRRQEAL